MGKSEEFMEKQMIDLSNELEGYEEYMTQNLDGSVCKWEYKPYKGLYKWESWFLEPKKNNYMVSASGIENKCWEESLIDLATHTPYLKDGILLGVAKIVSNIKRSDNRGFMIDLSDNLEGYENYVTQDSDGDVYKWELKPELFRCEGVWDNHVDEPASNHWYIQKFNICSNPNWEESLVDLSTHVPWLINGILTPIPKLMIPNEECYTENTDIVNKPEHYRQGDIECIDAIKSATTHKLGIAAVCVANVIKYLWRYESKNGLEDVKKAQWYLNRLVMEIEKNNSFSVEEENDD